MTKKDILEREKIIKEIQNEKWGIDTRRPAERFQPLADDGDGVEECDNITAVINQLNDAILDFEAMENIKDWRKESPNIWTACMMYTGKKVFPDNESKKVLRSKERYKTTLNGGTLETNHNKYDDDIIYHLLEHYIYVSTMRDMPTDLIDFAHFLNIQNDILWKYDERLTRSTSQLLKKLSTYEEKSLKSIAVSGKRSTVGTLATLNKKFGWNQPDKEIYIESADVSAVGLPDLSAKNLLNG